MSNSNNSIAIELENLHKRFGRRKRQVHAVRGLNLGIETGQVYGFLGPNGAGKSTTIRMIMDLVHPTDGEVRIFGQPVRQYPAVLHRVGGLVEGATFYPFLTGRKNLETLSHTSNCYDPARIQMLLEQVDMADKADRRVKGYSTGMKQRLGLAAALLADPDLVILDEPTNGLDPAGIQEVRQFIRQLVDEQGKTVFLSSHMLSEVEQLCDRVAIIQHGEIVHEGNVAELLTRQAHLKIEAEPIEKVVTVLSEMWEVTQDGKWIIVNAGKESAPIILQQLIQANVSVYQLQTERLSLEQFFLSVTNTT